MFRRYRKRRKYASKAALYGTMGISTEKKVIDNTVFYSFDGGTPGTAVGEFTALNLIRIGSTMNNRIGRKIKTASIRINGGFFPQMQTSNHRSPTQVRLMVVYDRQTNGNLPVLSDVIQCIDQAGTQTTDIYCGMNLNNRDRFLVLHDSFHFLPGLSDNTATGVQNGYPTNSDNYQVNVYRKIKNLETLYKADSSPAVIGDISTGSIFMLAIHETLGTETDAGTYWEWHGNMRLRFFDA